ncbi:uncharacterized protein [Solanum tuberosum]|uniref:uncharacterized protein n=1 Tax=Solanum tuberosum TaxID=4113 RepID=UPI00073A4DC8|nr:PREDICTED: uncharacterized protein LOC107061703 [Solanum tuberosum]
MAKLKVRDMAIPRPTNVTSCIQKPEVGGRSKLTLMSCPHHHQSNEVLVHTFIEGLEPNIKILLDSAADGQALKKTYGELFTLLSKISQGNPEWNGGGVKPNMMNTHFTNLALGQQSTQEMHNEEEASRIMGTLITQVGATTRTFLGVEIKIRVKAIINIDPKEMHRGTNHRPNGSSRISNLLVADVRSNQLITQNLEKQFGKFSSAQNSLPQGGLPRNTDPNPKQVNAVGTRSGLQLEELAPKKRNTDAGIPRYAKYVKEIVANKRRLTEYETVALTEECSSRIQNKLPTKLKDSDSFTVQITIGQSIHARGLCDLGASINLMPTSLYKKLGASGVVNIPVDIIVLNFEPDPDVPFILGRSFLATRRTMIDVAAAQLTMRSHDKMDVFDVYKALKLPAVYEELSAITVIDLEAEGRYIESKDPL